MLYVVTAMHKNTDRPYTLSVEGVFTDESKAKLLMSNWALQCEAQGGKADQRFAGSEMHLTYPAREGRKECREIALSISYLHNDKYSIELGSA